MKKILTLFFLPIYTVLYSQTEPQFTQYMYNRFLVNPAYSGSNDAVEFHLLHRSQYVSLAGKAIASQAFNFNIPVYVASSGVGLTVVNDLIGFQRSTYVNAQYNYRKKFKWGNMAVGISGGIVQTSIDGSLLSAPDGIYTGGVNHNDNFLPNNLQQGVAPDFSVGVYFSSDKHFAGAALSHIVLTNANVGTPSGKSKLVFNRTCFFTGGYHFVINPKITISPAALVKTNFVNVQTDLSVNFLAINTIVGGISFRGYTKKTVDALALILGFRYKGLQLAYSYDANLSYLSMFNSGSHEVSLSYSYMLKKKEVRGYFFHHPRFNL